MHLLATLHHHIERKHVPSVSLSIRQFVCLVYCGKMADWIWMLFGMVGRLGPRIRQVVGGLTFAPQQRAVLWVNVGVPL